jgi:hypothetical protein
MSVPLSIRLVDQPNRIVPGWLGRRGIELYNDSEVVLGDVVIAGLGLPFVGCTLLGSPIPLLEPGQSVPFYFDRPPRRAPEWVFRVSAALPDGTLFALNLTHRPRG